MNRPAAALAATLALLAFMLAPAGGQTARAAQLSISCSSLGKEYEICREGVEAWAQATGNSVRIVSTPDSASERLGLYQQLLAAGASDIDVFQIDVVWPGILAAHFVDLSEAAKDRLDAHFPAIVENNRVDGRLVAMPWFADAGLLYYRSDLLEKYGRPVPRTWEDLQGTARLIQEGERKDGNAAFWGYVFQARAYEGLTVNALEWIASHGGGTIVDAQGEVTINNPQAQAALDLARGFIADIAPEGVLNYTEEEARGVFQAGNAAFMRNWPYAWALGQGEESAVRGRIGVAPLPSGPQGQSAAGLGGQQLAVSRYSKHPDLAIDLVMYLTSAEEQKRRAVAGSFNPTITALYEDPDILAAAPFIGELREVFTGAVARPATVTGANYNRVSSAFFDTVHQVLSGRTEPQAALAALESELQRIKRRGWSR